MSHQSELIATDIDAYLRQHEQKELMRFITCGSVDDGKSTLIGRLLYDSKMIYKDQLSNGGRWNLLGRYSFSSELKVTIRVPGSASVCADAVKFVLAGSSPPPDPDEPPVRARDAKMRPCVGPDGGMAAHGRWCPFEEMLHK